MIYYLPTRYSTPKWQARIVQPDNHFRFIDEQVVSSLWELKSALHSISDEVLSAHVSQDKNDVADWVEHVILDTDLTKALRKHTNRWGLIVALERQMMRTLNLPPYVAKRWLSPSPSQINFNSGESAFSLEELASVLEQISDETVEYHQERVPNDISQWVLFNIGDFQLSDLLEEASNRSQMHRFTVDHIAMLKDALD